MSVQRDIERLLEQAREEGRKAGRKEGTAALTEAESGATLLGNFGEAAAALGAKTNGTARKVFEEAAAILRDGETQVREELRGVSGKRRPKKNAA